MLEDWQKWFAIIAGDVLLLAALFALARGAVTKTIKNVLTSELAETKEHVKDTDAKLDQLVTSGAKRDTTLEELSETVRKVVYQVEPNKGGSLRDSVVRTEQAVKELDSKMELKVADLESKIDSKLDDLGDKISDTRDRVSSVEGQIRDR